MQAFRPTLYKAGRNAYPTCAGHTACTPEDRQGGLSLADFHNIAMRRRGGIGLSRRRPSPRWVWFIVMVTVVLLASLLAAAVEGQDGAQNPSLSLRAV